MFQRQPLQHSGFVLLTHLSYLQLLSFLIALFLTLRACCCHAWWRCRHLNCMKLLSTRRRVAFKRKCVRHFLTGILLLLSGKKFLFRNKRNLTYLLEREIKFLYKLHLFFQRKSHASRFFR